MIQSYTRLNVADNSGAREVMVIRVVGGGKAAAATIGNIIIGSVKSATAHTQVKKKEVIRGVIVRLRKPIKRPDGTSVRFDDNAVVLINPDKTPRGSRIFGPVGKELKDLGFGRIISMALEVL
ncbi:MAG: 50S ribosomal protein L14 [Berkelbacteria bacterium GW2011_GWB1_38_5]|uniref:Large ribosomal subunit protein uL14 n=2 Tax=Candidatus Berkelbacteria TaxID=1618330 RepID=A0A0G0LIS4_9BACT|nr:MAG: 50S ribosomal protein L14 [Berkelbacteria bacterium GW2011_GWB1_38_5]KKQ90967.1 MAG: 50S ribosomal protein L14 [Berkelbacteria bacterium GW2011_GWA1_39_10]